jgi:hypothetical protein
MSGLKSDQVARELFGPAYDGIPKSVFAVAAFYLADACSELGAGQGDELNRLAHEFSCLAGQVIDPEQAKRALAALRKAMP